MDPITELRAVAQDIEQRRLVLELSQNSLCKKFGHLGSTKTYSRILDESDPLTEGLDINKQLNNYRAALELINSFTEDPEENKIYADFDFMRRAFTTVTECMQVTDNTRLVLVTGISGAGKTAFKDALMADSKFNRISYAVEATEAWRTKETALMRALYNEINTIERNGEDKEGGRPIKVLDTMGANQFLEMLTEKINGRKMIIVIDEAHHLGPQGLNIVKTLINQTRAIFVLLAHPALMAHITKRKFDECSQLWHNRLFQHIRWPMPSSGDVLEFLTRQGLKFATVKDANAIALKVSQESEACGCWKFVKRCAKEARKQGRSALTAGDFVALIGKVKNKISLGG